MFSFSSSLDLSTNLFLVCTFADTCTYVIYSIVCVTIHLVLLFNSMVFCTMYIIICSPTIPYSGNLSREKTFANLWKNVISWRKLSWIVCLYLLCQTIAEKTFADRHKTAKFAKVFSLESFPLYGTNLMIQSCILHRAILLFTKSQVQDRKYGVEM